MRILHLYRPRLPSTRAQAIQVFRTCHALADRGHDVTVLADRGHEPAALWERMGLPSLPTLNVQVSPFRHPGLAGLWFRRRLKRWWSGPPGVVLARDKRRLLAAVSRLGRGEHTIVLETHEHESGDGDARAREVESRCLAIADALVANCGGTLQAWIDTHAPAIPTHICHNASHIHSAQPDVPEDHVLVLGTLREFKGVGKMLEAMETLDYPIRWLGAEGAPTVSAHIKIDGPIPHAEIHEWVPRARVLVAPLGDNRFSHRLTSPLKLWDYLGTTRPIVTAETAATDEIMRLSGTKMYRFRPDSVAGIRAAIQEAWVAPPRDPFHRSWHQRAIELEAIFAEAQHA